VAERNRRALAAIPQPLNRRPAMLHSLRSGPGLPAHTVSSWSWDRYDDRSATARGASAHSL